MKTWFNKNKFDILFVLFVTLFFIIYDSHRVALSDWRHWVMGLLIVAFRSIGYYDGKREERNNFTKQRNDDSSNKGLHV